MCFHTGKLVNKTINSNETNFSLEGMIAPTFQNEGISDVRINGRLIKPLESYSVNVPTVILQNTISIIFSSSDKKENNLKLDYVELIIS